MLIACGSDKVIAHETDLFIIIIIKRTWKSQFVLCAWIGEMIRIRKSINVCTMHLLGLRLCKMFGSCSSYPRPLTVPNRTFFVDQQAYLLYAYSNSIQAKAFTWNIYCNYYNLMNLSDELPVPFPMRLTWRTSFMTTREKSTYNWKRELQCITSVF